MIQLYEDQEEFVQLVRQSLGSGKKSILGVASPAFGKTVVAGAITQMAKSKNPDARVWFLVHRKNLLRQTSKSFWRSKIEHGLLTSGRTPSKLAVQVGTIGTVFSRIDTLVPPSILFIDEAHLSKGNMFQTVIKWALDARSIVIGLTGTPERLDGKPLNDLYQVMVEAKSTAWLIEQRRLSDYDVYSTAVTPDLSSVAKSGGDYNREQLASVMSKGVIVGDAVDHWRRFAKGLRTVCYCVNVNHSKETAAYFNAQGIPAVHVDASTTEAQLKDACEGLADRRYLVLCNCELVIEGFDLSAQVDRDVTLECCILLRPTQSKARYLQMVFRALRAKPTKAVILDHSCCVARHGFPDDDQEWSLENKEKHKKKNDEEEDIKVKVCEKCYAIFRPTLKQCPKCGEAPEPTAREIQVEAGRLELIDREKARRDRRQEQGMARNTRSLIELAIRRGSQKPSQWAAITMAARENRKPVGKDFNDARKILMEIKENEGKQRPEIDSTRAF